MGAETALRDLEVLLLQLDSEDPWFYPLGFDYQRAQHRFGEFLRQLENLFGAGLRFETGAQIQDATFHSQVHLPGGLLRFSNFGDMVALSPGHDVPPELVEIVEVLAEVLGYRVIPTELLERKYPASRTFQGVSTWWVRYFDWV